MSPLSTAQCRYHGSWRQCYSRSIPVKATITHPVDDEQPCPPGAACTCARAVRRRRLAVRDQARRIPRTRVRRRLSICHQRPSMASIARCANPRTFALGSVGAFYKAGSASHAAAPLRRRAIRAVFRDPSEALLSRVVNAGTAGAAAGADFAIACAASSRTRIARQSFTAAGSHRRRLADRHE